MLEVRETGLDDVLEIRPPRFADNRGFFSEVWNAAAWSAAGLNFQFVQDNHSLSRERGTLRGLHIQIEPFAQDKLVRVTRGAVFDVAVDLRALSPNFRRWVGIELSAEKWNQLLIPRGFAHGFLTLEPDTEVQYKVTAPYSPERERTIRYDDPDLKIGWPIAAEAIILSDKDRQAPLLSEIAEELE